VQYAGFGGQASKERRKNAFHAAAIERSKGQRPVSLEPFRHLEPSPATGSGSKKRLTNLQRLNVDTSWYLRYRAATNPDFGATFGQAVTITNQPVIPSPTPRRRQTCRRRSRCRVMRRTSACRRSPTALGFTSR
jgi:hypothetical protein